MRLSDLQRAIERARRLYATSATKPNEVFDDEDFTARKCARAGCYGNHILAHPRRAIGALTFDSIITIRELLDEDVELNVSLPEA